MSYNNYDSLTSIKDNSTTSYPTSETTKLWYDNNKRSYVCNDEETATVAKNNVPLVATVDTQEHYQPLSQKQQHSQSQQQHLVKHYFPISESTYGSKRKFQSDNILDDLHYSDNKNMNMTTSSTVDVMSASTSSDQYQQQSLIQRNVTASSISSSDSMTTTRNTTKHNNNHSSDAGLSLLFAASLLQQQQSNARTTSSTGAALMMIQQHSEVASNTANAPTVPTVANTTTISSGPATNNVTNSTKNNNDTNTKPTTLARKKVKRTTTLSFGRSAHVDGIDGNNNDNDTIDCTTFIEPTMNDVLCGRGGGINKHYGNMIYRRVVDYNKKVYKQVPKRHRMLVSRSIVQAIINAGGRFLQEHKGGSENKELSDDRLNTLPNDTSGNNPSSSKWTQIQIRRAVQKTSQALRERKQGDDDDNDEEEEHDYDNGNESSDDIKGEKSRVIVVRNDVKSTTGSVFQPVDVDRSVVSVNNL